MPTIRLGIDIVLLAGGAILLAIILAITLWNVHLQWRLRKHRGMTKAFFLAYFVDQGIRTEIAAAVYDHYRSKAFWRDFGILPGDDIRELFKESGDENVDTFERILKRLGLVMPPDEAWDARGEPPVKTVQDLIRAIAWAEQNQPLARNGSTTGMPSV